MANVLGTILVDLQASTGGFVSAMSKAAVEAQKASREISKNFRELGEIAGRTFGPFGEEFNPIISKLSFVLSSAGSAASSMMKEFQNVGGVLGPLASLGAGAAVGIAAAGASLVGVAIESSEAAGKLLQLSRSTGVSVESLSALQFAAKQTGIEQAQLVKSLQLLSTNMVKAAKEPEGVATAFSKLGLNIRQQNGDLKEASGFLGEVITRLSEMRDKTAAVGLAKGLIGKGGATMLQLGDPEEIQHWIEKAKELGLVISTDTAVAAEHFNQTLGLIRASATGVANRIMTDLLPALQAVATQFEKASSKGNSFGKDLLWVIEGSIKLGIAVGQTWATAFEQIGLAIKAAAADWLSFIDLVGTTGSLVAKSVTTGGVTPQDLSNAKQAFSDFLSNRKSNIRLFNDESKRLWQENSDFIESIFGPRPPWTLDHRGDKDGESGLEHKAGAATSGRPDVVAEMISKLQAQAAAELELASAIEKSTSATILAKAAAEADKKVAETRAHLLEQEKELRERLASEPDSKHAPTIQAQIADIQKMLAELEKSTPQIKALYAEIASAGFAAKSTEELEKFTVKTSEQTEALRQMAAAYSEGPLAVQRAQQNAKIAPFEKQRADLGELIPTLKTLGAPEADVAKLQTAYDQLGASIDRAKASISALNATEISEKIEKERFDLQAEADAYSIVASAALKSAAAQREAAAQAEVVRFQKKEPAATPEALQGVYNNALDKLNQQRELTIAQTSAQYSLSASYSQEIEKLQEIRTFLQSSGESTIAIDTKIYETKTQHLLDYQKQVFESQNQELLGQQRIYEESVRLTEEWDRAAMEVGTIGEKWRAVVNEIELSGKDLGGKLFSEIPKMFDDLSTQLSHFIVTGKNGFKQMIESWEENLVKLSLQKTFSAILGKIFNGPQGQGQGNQPWDEKPPGNAAGPLGGAGGGIVSSIASIFGLKLPGAAGGAADGSSGKPFYVVIKNPAEAAGGTSGGGGPLGDILSIFGGGGDSSGGSGDEGGIGSLLSGIPVIGSLFGSGGGLGGKPDGSKGRPFHVVSADSSGSGGLGSLLSSFGGGGDSSGDGGGDGGGIGGLLSIFGGFMDDGGRVSKGTPYIVGENRPEIFVPDQAGKIVPSISQFANSAEAKAMKLHGSALSRISRREHGGSVMAGMPYLTGEKRPEVFVPDSGSSRTSRSPGRNGEAHTHVHLEFPNVRDYDNFKRSQSQIHGELTYQAMLVNQRTG